MAHVPAHPQTPSIVRLPDDPMDPTKITDRSIPVLRSPRPPKYTLNSDGTVSRIGDEPAKIHKFEAPPVSFFGDLEEAKSAAVRVPLAAPFAVAELAGLPVSEALTEFGLPPLRSVVPRTLEMFSGGLGFEAAIKGAGKGKRLIQGLFKEKKRPDAPTTGPGGGRLRPIPDEVLAYQQRSVFAPTGASLYSNIAGSTAATAAAISAERAGADPFTQAWVTGGAGVAGGISPRTLGFMGRYFKSRFKTADDLLTEDISRRVGNIETVRTAAAGLAGDIETLPAQSRPTVLGLGGVDPAASPGFRAASQLVRGQSAEAEQRVALGRREDVTKLGEEYEARIPRQPRLPTEKVGKPIPEGESGRIAQQGFEQQFKKVVAGGKALPDVGEDILDKAIEARIAARKAASAAFKALPQESVTVKYDAMNPEVKKFFSAPDAPFDLAKSSMSPATDDVAEITRRFWGLEDLSKHKISLKDLRALRTETAEQLARATGATVEDSAKIQRLRIASHALNDEINTMIKNTPGDLGVQLREANEGWKRFTRLWNESKIAKLGFTNRSGELPDTSPDEAFNIIFGDPRNRGLVNVRDFQRAIGVGKANEIVEIGAKSLIAEESMNLRSREQIRRFAQRFSTVLKETGSTFLSEFDEAGRQTASATMQFEGGPEAGISALRALVSPSVRQPVKDAIIKSITLLSAKHPEFKNAVTSDLLREIGFQSKIFPSKVAADSTMDAAKLGEILARGDRQLRQVMGADAVEGLRRLQRVMAAVGSIPATVAQAQGLSRADLTREVATIASRMFAFRRGAVGPTFILTEAAARQVAKITNDLSDGELLKMYDELLHNPDILGSLARVEKFGDVAAAFAKAARNARLFRAAAEVALPGAAGATIQYSRPQPSDAPKPIGTQGGSPPPRRRAVVSPPPPTAGPSPNQF